MFGGFSELMFIGTNTVQNKSSYFRVKLKRIKFELYTEPELD